MHTLQAYLLEFEGCLLTWGLEAYSQTLRGVLETSLPSVLTLLLRCLVAYRPGARGRHLGLVA